MEPNKNMLPLDWVRFRFDSNSIRYRFKTQVQWLVLFLFIYLICPNQWLTSSFCRVRRAASLVAVPYTSLFFNETMSLPVENQTKTSSLFLIQMMRAWAAKRTKRSLKFASSLISFLGFVYLVSRHEWFCSRIFTWPN